MGLEEVGRAWVEVRRGWEGRGWGWEWVVGREEKEGKGREGKLGKIW